MWPPILSCKVGSFPVPRTVQGTVNPFVVSNVAPMSAWILGKMVLGTSMPVLPLSARAFVW